MKIKIFYDRDVNANAAHYYELAKECKSKVAGLEKAIQETEKEMKKASKKEKKLPRMKREKEWFEKFHHSFTYSGKLIIAGRSAQQNDQLFAKYMEPNDLFFHADIQGGAATILKDGADASEEEFKETAQIAACFSKAWVNANAAVDVYAVKKEQLSKHSTGGYIPTGAFAISGERKWFRGTKLELRIGLSEGKLHLVSSNSKVKLDKELILIPSKTGKTKGALAKSLAKRFNVHPDELLELLPNGKTKTKQK